MPETGDVWDKPQPLLPERSPQDRPMFIILVILAFLATLSLLSIKSSFSTAKAWKAELQNTLTVQVLPVAETITSEAVNQVKTILTGIDTVKNITVLPDEYAKSLLAPWIGETPLPDDIELPVLLNVELNDGTKLDVAALNSTFEQAGLSANIDDHQQWESEFRKSVIGIQTLAILAFLLIFAAIMTAVIFATRSGLTGRRMLIDVLHQIGAAPNYTAQLFSRRYALTAAKAGAIGAVAALIVLLILGLVTAGAAGSMKFIPDIRSGPGAILWAILIPVAMAAIAGISAWRTVLKTLYDEVYP